MSLRNQHWLSLAGEPITGRVPPNLRVMNGVEPSSRQMGEIAHHYKLLTYMLHTAVIPFLIQERTLADGTRIRMISNYGVDTVMVWPVGGGPTPLVCPSYLSGVMLNGWNASRMVGTPPAEVVNTLYFYPSEKDAAGEPRDWRVLPMYQEMGESTHGVDWLKFKLPWLTPLREPVPLTPPEPWTHYTEAPQVAFIRPGMYSGTMRAVVQYMLGAKIPVKFDYRFTSTHGIINIPHADKKIPWVIEISAQFGVLASRLKLCKKPDKFSPLGYTPLGSDLPSTAEHLPALIAKGKVIRLLTAEEMGAFFEYMPFFLECGWAFSYSGTEAQNTCIGKDGIYLTALRFKLTFSYSGGVPTAATLAQVDGGYMISNPGLEEARSQVRVPDYRQQGCVTVDMRPDIEGAHSVDSICPIYVYYDGDTEQIVQWVNEKPVVDDTLAGMPAWSTFNCEDQSMYGRRYLSAIAHSGMRCRYYQITSPIHPTADLFTRDGVYTVMTPILHNGWKNYCRHPPENPSGIAVMQIYTIYSVRQEAMVGVGTGSRHTLTIPLYERELIYHMRQTEDFENGNTTSYSHWTTGHRDTGSINYFIGKEWDPEKGDYVDPYKWRVVSSNPPAGGTHAPAPWDVAFSPVFPVSLFGANFDAPPGYVGFPWPDPWVTPVYNSTAPYTAPTARERISTLHIQGSGFGRLSAGFKPGALYPPDQWLKVLPDAMGWTSQMWVARSASGMHVVPKGEREAGITPDEDFALNLGEYPKSLALSAPWLIFLGSAEDEPSGSIRPPPNFPRTFEDPAKL